MKRYLTIILFLASFCAIAQENIKSIIGVFDNHYGNSYFIIKFNIDSTFNYKAQYDLGSCIFIGKYVLHGDTIILELDQNISSMTENCSFSKQRWLIIDPNLLFS
jgi:hypothetical protein